MKLHTISKALICFVLLFSLLPFAQKADAATPSYNSKVNAASLNVRAKAGTKYAKVGTLKKNQVVSVSKTSNGWSYVTLGKTKGWVSSKHLQYISWKGYVNAGSLNVRKSASNSSSKITSLKKGTSVTISGQTGNWGKIYISQKKSHGWISLTYISKKAASSSKKASFSAANLDSFSYKSKVTASSLNVRAKAGTQYAKVGSIKKNQIVTVSKISKDWSYVTLGKTKGWVSSKYLQYISWKGYVNAGTLNVRKTASTSSEKISSLNKGTTVTISAQNGNWGRVYISKSKGYGWISLSYVSKKPVNVSVPANIEKTYYVTTDSLNVRSSGTIQENNILFQLKLNEAVVVSEKQGNWGKIKTIDGKTGWASLSYLSEKPVTVPTPPPTEEEEVTAPNGLVYLLQDGNIRNGPGTSFEIVATKKVGTALTKLSDQDGWSEVMTEDGIQGWIASWLIGLTTPNQDKTIKGKVIVLDAGHGGKDSGAVGKNNYEKTLNLETVKEIQTLLEKEGANVILTRSDDTYLTLNERVNISHKYKAEAFISVHYNAGTSKSTGLMTFYYSKNKDQELAKYVQEGLIAETGMLDQGVRYGNFHVIRENKQPGILLELGFISNPDEEKIIATKEFRQKAAKGVVSGLVKYFESR